MRRALFGGDPGKLTMPEFMDVLRTAAQFRAWELGKGEMPTLPDDQPTDHNADLRAMAERVPNRTK